MRAGWELGRRMREAGVPVRYWLRVRERIVILEYATEHGVRPAARRFGGTSRTIASGRSESDHGISTERLLGTAVHSEKVTRSRSRSSPIVGQAGTACERRSIGYVTDYG